MIFIIQNKLNKCNNDYINNKKIYNYIKLNYNKN